MKINFTEDELIATRVGAMINEVDLDENSDRILSNQIKSWFCSGDIQERILANKADIFRRLVRADEYKTLAKNYNCCWEPYLVGDVNDYRTPFIDNLLDIKAGEIKWPGEKRFALCLTHDMDILHSCQIKQKIRSLKYHLKAPLRRKMIFLLSILKHAMMYAFSSRTSFPIDAWMKIEDQFGFRSTMFFLAGPPAMPHYWDFLYHISDNINYGGKERPLKEVIHEIAEAGWEVGLHGGIHSSLNSNLLSEERERLCDAARVEVVSGRQHYLMYDIRITPLVHENAGLLVDSSLGSNTLPYSYRCGTGLPHRMYDMIDKRVINVLQVPMIIHDVPLITAARGNSKAATDIVFKILEAAAKRGTIVTIVFHNNCFEDETKFLIYKEVLQIAHDLGAWGCSVKDIYEWYITRENCYIKRTQNESIVN